MNIQIMHIAIELKWRLHPLNADSFTVYCALCRSDRFTCVLIPHLNFLPGLSHSIAPRVELLCESVELAAFQDSGLDPGYIGGGIDLI